MKKFFALLDAGFARWSWRALGTRRVLVVATLLALISFGALRTLAPPEPVAEVAIVAARDLGIGETVRAADLKTVRVTPGVVPESALIERDKIIDQVIGVPVPAGLFITASALNTSHRYDDLPAGRVAAPVRFADPQLVQLLQPGDFINVLVAHSGGLDSASAEVVAHRALVLAVPSPGESGGLLGAGLGGSGAGLAGSGVGGSGLGSSVSRGFSGSSSSGGGNIAILAVTESEAADLAAASQLGALSIALVQ